MRPRWTWGWEGGRCLCFVSPGGLGEGDGGGWGGERGGGITWGANRGRLLLEASLFDVIVE